MPLATEEEVLIVGAGPTGLTLAIELLRAGVPVRLIDKADHPARYSQALIVQARTLEQFARYGLAERAVSQGRPITVGKFWSEKELVATIDLTRIPGRFPFALVLPQNDTEALLTEHLRALGGSIERHVELTAIQNSDEGVTAYLKHADGRMEQARYRWLVGCDGAHSTVRHGTGIAFEGDTVPMRFELGDLRLTGEDVPDDEVSLHWRHGGDVLFIAKLRGDLYRVIVIMRGEEEEGRPKDNHILQLDEFNATFARFSVRMTATESVWAAPFHVNERKAKHYREKSVFLAGDASHIHSPAGGQGMNTGIQDAANLGWKLAAVARGADAKLLDSYDAERSGVGKAVLRGSSFALRMATVESPLAEHLRNFVMHYVTQFGFVQDAATRTMSETGISYRGSPAVHDDAYGGPLRAGDRMPDGVRGDGTTLLAALGEGKHLLVAVNMPAEHVPRNLRETAVIAVRTDEAGWSPALAELLGEEEQFYLVRPDGYIGFRGTRDNAVLQEYAERVGIA